MDGYEMFRRLDAIGGPFAPDYSGVIALAAEYGDLPERPKAERRLIGESDPVSWAEQKFGFVADALQAQVLRSKGKRGLLNCTRQWGKSSVTALKALWTALEGADAMVLVMSPSKRQSGEFLKKVGSFVRRLGLKLKKDGVNEMSLSFPNGSRIVALPGVEATMRGFSAVDLLIIDEAARVNDEQYLAAGPSLAVKDGAMWLLSTPKGSRGFFYQEWERGGAAWERVRVEAKDCPRISTSFLESERARIGEAWYLQEYCCEFVGTENSGFRREWIDAAWDEEGRELG